MQEDDRLLEKNSQFFAVSFKRFEQDLQLNDIQVEKPPYVQLRFSCCGYGYFQNYQDRMVENFIAYLTDAITACEELKTLKIVFNGFNIERLIIPRICQPIKKVVESPTFSSLWIHTTNLSNCSIADIWNVLSLIEEFGRHAKPSEISIQMSDWEFAQGYPAYQEFFELFYDLKANIMNSLFYRKFRFEISKWYLREKEAYSFLKDALHQQKIMEYFLSSKNDQVGRNSHNRVASLSQVQDTEKDQAEQLINNYINYIDIVCLFPPLPKKKQFEEQHQKIKKEQEKMIEKTKNCEDEISRKIMKFPLEYITQLRVDQFQKQMVALIHDLIFVMPDIEDFQIDMSNWNPMFSLENMKKQLDKTVYTKAEFSLMRKKKGKTSAQVRQLEKMRRPISEEQPTMKTKFMM